MLSVEPAARRRHSQQRVALALAGGGPLGSFYQLGCLHALSDCTEGLDLTQLDSYVGVSSGAVIAAGLANGLSTRDMIRLFLIEDAAEPFPLTAGLLMRPAIGEYVKRASLAPWLAAQILTRLARDPLNQNWAGLFSPLLHAIPTGVFDNRPFERYLRRLLSEGGRTNDFRKLPHPLRIVATDLDSGTEVRFGEQGLDHVPISEAIRASTALPGLYTPVRFGSRTCVDGALLRTMHASLVLERGVDLVISVNPLVTFDASRAPPGRHDLADLGLTVVLSQTFRAMIQSRMQIGMASYHARYPFSDRLLFEPDRDDETLFFINVFRYSERQRLAAHAYQHTRRDLLAHAQQLGPLLQRHGIHLRHDRLHDARSTFRDGIERGLSGTAVARHLSTTLDRLSQWIAQAP